MRIIILLICAIVMLVSCSNDQSSTTQDEISTRIINGTTLTSTQSPQMVEVIVKYLNGEEGGCSGTVVGKNSVLSAAHCVLGDIAAVFVRNDNVFAQATQIVTPPSFRVDENLKAIFDDVAVIRTEDLPLPALGILTSQAIVAGDSLNIYGFGVDEDGKSGALKAGETSIDFVTPNHIFGVMFNGDGSNSCNGDSGGAAVMQFTNTAGQIGYGMVGIISSGTSADCEKQDVTLYTNLQNKEVLSFLLKSVPDLLTY